PFAGQVVFPDGSPARGLELFVAIRWSPVDFHITGAIDSGGTGRNFYFTTDDAGRFVGYMRRPLYCMPEPIVRLGPAHLLGQALAVRALALGAGPIAPSLQVAIAVDVAQSNGFALIFRKDRKETITFKAIARLPDRTMGGVAHAETNSEDN